MSHAAYTDLKAAWHTDKISTLRQGEQIVPPHVQLIISDLCNHDCHFCSYRMSGGLSSEQFGENGNMNPNRKIPTAKAKEILDDCAELGVKAIQFTGGGEPTVHPDHIEIFRHAQILGLETALVTNGFLLRDGWEEVLPKMKWIRVSVDASSPEVYGAVRRINPNGYWKVLSHVGDIVKATKGMDCLVGVGYVITKENWQDLALGLRRIRDTGVPYVRLSAMFSDGGSSYYDGVYENICKVIAPLKKDLEDGDFQIVDLFTDRIDDLDQGSPDYDFCGYQQFNCYVGGNLKVYRCCTTSYTLHGEVGDLSEKRFKDWFHSEYKKKRYDELDPRTCSVCQFNGKNRSINYMVEQKPIHVNFV